VTDPGEGLVLVPPCLPNLRSYLLLPTASTRCQGRRTSTEFFVLLGDSSIPDP